MGCAVTALLWKLFTLSFVADPEIGGIAFRVWPFDLALRASTKGCGL